MKLIIGVKGTGKTKTLIEMVNSTIDSSNGSVICIEKGDKLKFDIKYQCRLIDSDEYFVCDAQSLFVDRVIIKRVVILNMRHADHGMMPVERAAVQADRIVARHDRHVLAVGKFVVKVAAEIKIAVAVSRCGTHGARPPSFIHPVSISAVPVRMLKILKRTCVQSVSFMCLTLPRKKPTAFLCCRRILIRI